MKPDPATPTADDMAKALEWLLKQDEPKTIDGFQIGCGFGSMHYTEKVVTKLYLGGKLTRHATRVSGRKFVGFTVRMPGEPKVAS